MGNGALRFHDTRANASRLLWSDSGVACFAVSARGNVLAYAERAGASIRVHALDTLAPVASLRLPGGVSAACAGVTALALSRDGTLLAASTASPDLVLHILDASTGEPVAAPARLASEAVSAAFDPHDAHRLLLTHAPAGVLGAHPGVTLHVVDPAYDHPAIVSRPLLLDAAGVPPAAATAAAWSPEKTAYVGTEDGLVLVLDPVTGDAIDPPEPVARAVAASRSKAPAGEPGTAAVVPPPGLAKAWAATPGGGAVRAVAFAAGAFALAGGRDAAVVRFYERFKGAASGGGGAESSAAYAGLTRTVALEAPSVSLSASSPATRVAFSPSFDACACATRDGGVYVLGGLLDRGGALAETSNARGDDVRAADKAMETIREPEGEDEGAAGADLVDAGVAKIPGVVKIGDAHAGAARGVVALADGGAVTCGADGTVKGWRVDGAGAGLACAWTRRLGSPQTAACGSAAASGAGSGFVFVASRNGTLRAFDARRGSAAGAVPGLLLRARVSRSSLDAIAASPSGARVAALTAEGACWFAEAETTGDADVESEDAGGGAGGAAAARLVGSVALPFARAVAAAWVSETRLLVSGVDGELASVTAPPAGAANAEAARTAKAATDVALVALAARGDGGDGGEGGSLVFAAGADGSVRAYDVPPESAFEGATLAARATANEGAGRAAAAAGLAAGFGGDAFAAAAANGAVTAWALDGRGGALVARCATRAAHSPASGGALAVAALRDGRLASAGAEGAVAVTAAAPGFSAAAAEAGATDAAGARAIVRDVVADAEDREDEPLAGAETSEASVSGSPDASLGSVPAASAAALPPEAASARAAAAAKIADLKKRLEDAIARNDAAEESTRVPREELLVDDSFRARLVAEGERRVEAARASQRLANLRSDFAASKIVAECWDTMETGGVAVVAANTPGLAVHRYPLAKRDRDDVLGERVAFLRRVEMAEHAYLAERAKEAAGGDSAAEAASSGSAASDDVFDLRVDAPAEAPAKDKKATAKGGGAGASKEPSKKPTQGAAGGSGGKKDDANAEAAEKASTSVSDPDSFEAALYDPSRLYPPRRKTTQISLLKSAMREVKREFNVAFAGMQSDKQKFSDKIGELNSRISDIRAELKGHTEDDAPLFRVPEDSSETETFALDVKDEEIEAEKWLSPEERAKIEAEEEAERRRLAAKGANPPEERALKDMMGGVLAASEEGGVPDELPKPEWMVEIPREEWNDEQKKQGREFENKAKVYREELAKRRAALAVDLARLHEESAETVRKFDQSLRAFCQRRDAVDAKLAGMERRVVALSLETETALEDDEVEEARLARMTLEAREDEARAAERAASFEAQADAHRRRVATCEAQNQKLEREFKRDLADADDLLDDLFALFKRRKAPAARSPGGASAPAATPRQQRVASGSGSAAARETHETTVANRSDPADPDPFAGAGGGPAAAAAKRPRPPPPEPLDESLDCPEGANEFWSALVERRDAKIAKEEELRALRETLEEMEATEARLRARAEAEKRRVAELDALADASAKRRVDSLYDLELPIAMKQAFVEWDTPELRVDRVDAFAASSSDAVLVHRGVVEYLNEVIAAHGDGKVATLVAIKDFKTGIYDLQWETAKLAMESEDLVEKIRELQMTRAPQNLLQDILVEPTAAKPPSASAAALDGDAVNKAAKSDAVANRRKNEMASLEARLDRAKTLHARRVEEKRREVAKARNQAAKIAARNEEIMAKVAEMDAATRDVAKLRRVSDATRGGGGAAAATDNAAAAKEKKMRALVTQSKLQHIAKTQAEEMAALREELERARLRTFPSFVERTDRVRLPDIPDARRRR